MKSHFVLCFIEQNSQNMKSYVELPLRFCYFKSQW